MRFVWVVAVAILAFVAGFIPTFLIGIDQTADWTCDGVCFDRLDEVGLYALIIGGLCAVSGASLMWWWLDRSSGHAPL